MIKSLRSAAMLTVLALGLAGTQAQAAFSGSVGLAVFSPAINSSQLGSATTFTLGTLLDNGSEMGGFVGTGSGTQLGAAGSKFTLGTMTGFTFTSSVGTFAQNSLPVITSMSTDTLGNLFETFLIVGTFTGATTTGGAALSSSVTLTFSQTASNGSIGAGGTLQIPAATVPEPASVALMGLGFVAVAGLAARRRLAK